MNYGWTTVVPQSQDGFPVARAFYDEQSACYVNVAYFDVDGDPFTPASAQYRIDDIESATPIVTWTNLAIANSASLITVSSSQNALISLTAPQEAHRVTVQVKDGAGNVFYADGVFSLRRLFWPVSGSTADSDSPADF